MQFLKSLKSGPVIIAALLALILSTDVSAQPPDVHPCKQQVTETETLSTGVSAEINDHGDLLLLFDMDEDGEPERLLHAAPRHAKVLAAIVEELRAAPDPVTVRLLSRNTVAFSGFEIIGERGNPTLQALTGKPECNPEDAETDLWLNALAHYKLSDLRPLAAWTVYRLRNSSLIQGESRPSGM